jgi:hypothetical protein
MKYGDQFQGSRHLKHLAWGEFGKVPEYCHNQQQNTQVHTKKYRLGARLSEFTAQFCWRFHSLPVMVGGERIGTGTLQTISLAI